MLRAIDAGGPAGRQRPARARTSRTAGWILATSDANSYGQFRDDIVYFQDNFAGIGFWPAPAADATLPDGSPDDGRRPRRRPLLRLGPRRSCRAPTRRWSATRSTTPARWSARTASLFYLLGAGAAGLIAAVHSPVALQRPQPHAVAPALRRPRSCWWLLIGRSSSPPPACDTDSRSWSVLALLGLRCSPPAASSSTGTSAASTARCPGRVLIRHGPMDLCRLGRLMTEQPLPFAMRQERSTAIHVSEDQGTDEGAVG